MYFNEYYFPQPDVISIAIACIYYKAIRTDRTRGGRSSYDGCSPAPRLSLPSTPKTPGTKPPVKRKIVVPQCSQGTDGQNGNEHVSRDRLLYYDCSFDVEKLFQISFQNGEP